jgi:hypothetical protein
MDPGPLVTEQIDAGARFLAEFEKTIPVAAAFWLKRPDRESWNLYIASDQFRGEKRYAAYAEVGRVDSALREPYLGPFRIKLLEASDPLVWAALDVHRLYPGKAVRLRDTVFGGLGIDEIYIYPVATPVSSMTS